MSTATNIVLYDGDCSMCTFQMRVLGWLDWFNVARLTPLSDPLAGQVAPHVKREDLLEAIHCVTPDGRIHRGARCLRHVGLRIPLLFPLALILWVPGVIWVAEKIYAWVARNRYVLSRVFGCKDACAIMPERKRAPKTPAESARSLR
jgi:predicted DCC family thiol-disulfide oxidoreductase YuxK